MEDTWFILAAMPGWVYVDTGGSAEDAATLLQVISDDIIYGGVSCYCRWRSQSGLFPLDGGAKDWG